MASVRNNNRLQTGSGHSCAWYVVFQNLSEAVSLRTKKQKKTNINKIEGDIDIQNRDTRKFQIPIFVFPILTTALLSPLIGVFLPHPSSQPTSERMPFFPLLRLGCRPHAQRSTEERKSRPILPPHCPVWCSLWPLPSRLPVTVAVRLFHLKKRKKKQKTKKQEKNKQKKCHAPVYAVTPPQ